MSKVLDPFRFVLIALAGWINHRQYQVVDYLREENPVLRERLGDRRLRFNDDQRRCLALKAKALGHRLLEEMTSVYSPLMDFSQRNRRQYGWGKHCCITCDPIALGVRFS